MASLNVGMEDAWKLLSLLTWKKLFQFAVFLFLIGMAWAVYENRAVIYGFANQQRIESSISSSKTLSKKTIDEIDAIVLKSDIILGMNITLADFQRNERVTIYRSTELPSLRDTFDNYTKTSIGNVPLFNSDVDNNKLVVELINGEFVCKPYLETMTGKLIPDGQRYVHTICMNGIPASYGKFTGIISVQLKRLPNSSEYDQLRSTTRTMATTVFERDLSNHYKTR